MDPRSQVDPLLVDEEGHAEVLLGNEAIVRGALEAGVAFVSGYPGTPSSEVTDSFARVGPRRDVIFEYSVNEKIALELAFAASLAGARSLCAMKHVGLAYAADPLSTIPYIGTVGGMVIVSAGDPSCRTSSNEQDQRHLAAMLHLPLLDPSTPEEARQATRFAFMLSERCQLPVLLRPTTRVCHSRGVVRYGRLSKPMVCGFQRDPARFVPVPHNARRLRLEIAQRLDVARELLEASPFLRRTGHGRTGILASGATAATTADLLAELELGPEHLTLLEMAAIHPLPEAWLLEQLARLERLLVVEELSPYLEDAVTALCARHRLPLEILGKRTGHLPVPFEYEPAVIRRGLHDALGLGPAPAPPELGSSRPSGTLRNETAAPRDIADELGSSRPCGALRDKAAELPPRPPILCPGCPHRSTYFAANAAFGPGQLNFNDIGCYTLGYGPPLDTADALLSMGAGITLAAGISRTTGERTVAFIGDSTFFHSGMPALLDAIKEQVELVVVILDNGVTAMTGFQESPFAGVEGQQAVRRLSIEAVVRGLGAQHVERIDPYEIPAAIAALERARDARGVSVIISERPCGVFLQRETGARPRRARAYSIDHARCRTCGRETPHGARCEVAITRGYELHIAGSRAREAGRSTPLPAVAPCSTRCPLFLCIQGYVGHIAGGEDREAFEHIIARCPLPETVCRVCHRPCEEACVRAALDEPVAINALKRFAVEQAGEVAAAPPLEAEHDHSVAVVGAGPSGLCAAHELRLRGYRVTLLDANPEPGGLLLTGIPPFRLPREALRRDVQRILDLGVAFRGETALGRDVSLAQLLQGHDAVYLAIGAHRGLRLGLAGEEAKGAPRIVDALAYLKAANHDPGSAPTGRRVVVVGGGNAAVDAARMALRMGAEEVTIAYRRRREEMPALPEEVEGAVAEGVALETQLQPLSIFRGNRAGLECIRTEPGEPDASGRRRPVPVGGSETLLQADLIVVAIGQSPDGSAFARDDQLPLERNEDGTLRVDPTTGRTSHERIFAGGDLVSGERTVTWAMAQGLRAAWAIDRALRGAEAADRRLPPPSPLSRAAAREGWPRVERTDRAPRQHPDELPVEERKRGLALEEVVLPLDEARARAEAARCLACGLCGNCRSCIDLFGCPAFYMKDGLVEIDPAVCTGCGFCADFCPNGAIHPIEDEERR